MESKQEHIIFALLFNVEQVDVPVYRFCIRGIYLTATQEQTHKDRKQKLDRALRFSMYECNLYLNCHS